MNKVIYMTHEFAPLRGGIATYVEGMARATAERGITCEVWSCGSETDEDLSFPFRVIRLGNRPTQNWTDRLKLAKKIRQYEGDWDHVTLCLPEPGPLRLWLYRNVLGLPTPARVIPIFHGSELGLIRRWRYREYLLENLLAESSSVGVVSRFVERLLPNADQLRDKVKIVPGAPLSRKIADLTNDHKPLKNNDSFFQLLNIGRVQPRKGQLCIIEALGTLSERDRKKFRVVLIGRTKDPKYLNQIIRQARSYGIELIYEGECDEMAKENYLRSSNLFVFPSCADDYRVEGLGLAVLEAACYETPTLGNDHGGVPEAICDGKTGWLINTQDAKAFGQKLLDLEANRETCIQVGKSARQWALSQFSYQKNVDALFFNPDYSQPIRANS